MSRPPRAERSVQRRAVPRPARQRPQGRDPDPGILRSPRRDLAPRRSASHQQAPARPVPASGRRAGAEPTIWKRIVPGGASGLQIREGPRAGLWWVRLPLSSANHAQAAMTPRLPRRPARTQPKRPAPPRRASAATLAERIEGAGARARLRVPPAQPDAGDRRRGRRRRRPRRSRSRPRSRPCARGSAGRATARRVRRWWRASRRSRPRCSRASRPSRTQPTDIGAALDCVRDVVRRDASGTVLGAVRAVHSGDARCRLLSPTTEFDRGSPRPSRRPAPSRRWWCWSTSPTAASRRCARPIST